MRTVPFGTNYGFSKTANPVVCPVQRSNISVRAACRDLVAMVKNVR